MRASRVGLGREIRAGRWCAGVAWAWRSVSMPRARPCACQVCRLGTPLPPFRVCAGMITALNAGGCVGWGVRSRGGISTPRGPAHSVGLAIHLLYALDHLGDALAHVHGLGRGRVDERREVDESTLERLEAGQRQQDLGVGLDLVVRVGCRELDHVAAVGDLVRGALEQLVERRCGCGDVLRHALHHERGAAVEDLVGAFEELDHKLGRVLLVGGRGHERLRQVGHLGQGVSHGARHLGARALLLVDVLLRGLVVELDLGGFDELPVDEALAHQVLEHVVEEPALTVGGLVAREDEALQQSGELVAVLGEEAVLDLVLPLLR